MKKTYIIISVLIVVAALAGMYWFGSQVTGLGDESQEVSNSEKTFYVGKVGNQSVHLSYTTKTTEGMTSNCRYARDFKDSVVKSCKVEFSADGWYRIDLVDSIDNLIGYGDTSILSSETSDRSSMQFEFIKSPSFILEDFLINKNN